MSSKDINIPIQKGSNTITNGYGYITIPSDKSRANYLKDYYKTGYCIIVTLFNEIRRGVSVPKHLINDIQFPLIPGDKGSKVHWTTIPGTSELVITGIHLTPDEFGNSSELQNVHTYTSEQGSISEIFDVEDNRYLLSINGSQKRPGEVEFTITGNDSKVSLTLSGSGVTLLESDNVSIQSKEFRLDIDKNKSLVIDDDEFKLLFGESTITINKDYLLIDSDKIISLNSLNSFINISKEGVNIDTEKNIYVGGSKSVLYSKISSAEEIVDFSQIGVSSKVKVG